MLNYINIAEAFVRVEIIIFDKQLETEVYNDAFLSYVTYLRDPTNCFKYFWIFESLMFENQPQEQQTGFFNLKYRDIMSKMKKLGEIQQEISIGRRIL